MWKIFFLTGFWPSGLQRKHESSNWMQKKRGSNGRKSPPSLLFSSGFRSITWLISVLYHQEVEIIGVPHSPPSVTPASAFPPLTDGSHSETNPFICKAMKTQRTSTIPPWKALQVVKAMTYFLLPPHWAGDFLPLASGRKPSHPVDCNFYLFIYF